MTEDDKTATLALEYARLRDETDRIRAARQFFARQLGPLPAVAGGAVALVGAFSQRGTETGWWWLALGAFVLMTVVSFSYSRMPAYRELRAWRGATNNATSPAGWYEAEIELERSLYCSGKRHGLWLPPTRDCDGDLQLQLDKERRGVFLVQALLLIVLFLLLVAYVEGEDSKPPPASATVAEKDLAAFSSVDGVHTGPLPDDLCVVRFHARDAPARGRWWTGCELADRRLETVRDVRRLLAAKHEWSTYDGKVRYVIPGQTRITYVRGVAADQCPPASRRCLYRGGGLQYLFPAGLAPGEGARRECAEPSAAEAATRSVADRARYGPCR